MDHYKHPRNSQPLEEKNLQATAANYSCGDTVLCQALVRNNTLVSTGFMTSGCVISKAAASLLSVDISGKQLHELDSYSADTIFSLLGMELGPLRARCALLCLEALRSALKEYRENRA